MKLPSDIRFAEESIQKAFYKLEGGDDSERELFKFINQALDNIEENSFCGVQIPKKLIPTLVRNSKIGLIKLVRYETSIKFSNCLTVISLIHSGSMVAIQGCTPLYLANVFPNCLYFC